MQNTKNSNLNPHQQSSVRTAHITVPKCDTQ